MKKKVISLANGVADFVLGLQFIFRPSFWIMNYSYNSALDEELKKRMDKPFTDFDGGYTAKLDGITLWVANYPYACMTIQNLKGIDDNIRPSRLTILRLYKKYIKDYINYIHS